MRRGASEGEGGPAVLITGGAGFIGTNLAHRILSYGGRVIILDNLQRPRVERNLRWLRAQHAERLTVVVADVGDARAVAGAVRQSGQVYHLAGSVPEAAGPAQADVRGALNLCEALRQHGNDVPCVFASSRLIYGPLTQLPLQPTATRWALAEGSDEFGVDETHPVDVRSPHARAKAAAEAVCFHYGRRFGLAITVLRLGCVYGPHQGADSEQDWLCGMVLGALRGQRLRLRGDGREVTDALFVDDLIDGLLCAQANGPAVRGQVFNVGGGPTNTLSPRELLQIFAEIDGDAPDWTTEGGAPVLQRHFVSDVRRFAAATGWRPRVGVEEGVRRLQRWLLEHRVAVEEAERIAPPSFLSAEGLDLESHIPERVGSAKR